MFNFNVFLSIHFQSSLISKTKLESNSTQLVLFMGLIISILGATISGSHSGTFSNCIVKDFFRGITLQYLVVIYDHSINSKV
jgi:hypothetical protein